MANYQLIVTHKKKNKVISKTTKQLKNSKDVAGFRSWVYAIYPSKQYKVSLKKLK